ncbi:hypothetical protein ACM66B_004485 [Microbotryomycetes sp. NB124-2]
MPSDGAAPLLHLHKDHLELAKLIEPLLPVAQPTYNTLVTPNDDFRVYASFAPGGTPQSSDLSSSTRPYVILADLGTQIRPFCSVEADATRNEERISQGGDLMVEALREWSRKLTQQGQPDVVVVGAVHTWWGDCIKKAFGPLVAYGEYDVHRGPQHPPQGPVNLPAGFELGKVREQDIEQASRVQVLVEPTRLICVTVPGPRFERD